MNKFFIRIILSLILSVLALSGNSALAQSQATTGNIEGRVVDPNGAAVPNVTVTATSQDNGFEKSANTSSDGNFILPLLQPGNYRVVTAAAQGFGAATYENVIVTVGAKNTLEIVLSAGASTAVVDVQDSGQGVETTRTSISSTVEERRIINLPTNGRNFLDFVTLTPGIVRDPTRAGDLAVGGQKGTLNSLQIDGTSSDNTFFGQSSGRVGSGRAPSQFSVDTVKEFQVNQNGFSAEFGRAAGAVINVVTKSGTNRFTGSAFEYFRDESLNARNPNLVAARRARPAGQINQFGGTFGGPLKKDRIFFFGAYEGQRSNLPNPVVLPSLGLASTPASVQALLTPKVASYNINRQQDTYLGKVDFNINNRNQAFVRFNQQNFTGTNLENSGTLSSAEHTGNSNVKTSTLTASLTSTLTSNYINEFRFQYSKDREPGLSNSTAPEAAVTTPDGTFNFGRNNFSPRETTVKRYQFVNNQTYITGNHTIKYGADLLFDRVFNFFPGLFSGAYTFPSYTALANNQPSLYRQSFAGAGTNGATSHPNDSEYGFFALDDYRASSKLTFNVGLRYDYQNIAKPPLTNPNPALLAAGFDTGFQPKDKDNFATRLGASYAFNEKTVLRGGYGIFFGRTPAILTGTAHTQNGVQVLAFNLTCINNPVPPQVNPCPTYPNVLTSAPTIGLAPINLYLFDHNYRQPFTHQARVQFEREIFANTTFSVQYEIFRGANLTRTRNANLNAPVQTVIPIYNGTVNTGQTITVERFSNPRPLPQFARISLFESSANSFYQGLAFEVNRRFANHLQFNTSYTLSKAKDDKPDQTSVVPGSDDAKIAQNQFNLTGEYGRSDLDVRHRFIFSPVYETGTFKYSENKVVRALLSDYLVTGIFTAQSGYAYSAIISGDPNADGNTANDRVPGTKRNQYSTPSTYQLDLRVGRALRFGEQFRVTFFGEGFNIFNRPNIQNVTNTLYSFSNAGIVQGVPLPNRLSPPSASFNAPRQFVSGSPSFTFNSSYNREFQLGIRLDF